MMKRAEEKIEAIRKAKLACQGQQPIDQVVFAQNCLTYMPEWKWSKEGKLTSYLVTIICHFMDKVMRKDMQQILSSRALATIYGTASNSIRKLILGKHYLGGYALSVLKDELEVEGKEILTKKKTRRPLKDGAKPSTSHVMVH